MGDIDHAGHDHMVMVVIVVKSAAETVYVRCRKLSVITGYGKDFVACMFNGTRLMLADMAAVSGNDALVGPQYGTDDDGVCLRPARQEMDSGIFYTAGGPYLFHCAFAEGIRPVAGRVHKVGILQSFQYQRMGTFHIIGSEVKHGAVFCPVIRILVHSLCPFS